MRDGTLRKFLRFLTMALPPSAFALWAVRFAGVLANPAIHAFGDVEQQIAQYRAGLFADAVWGAVILAVWAGVWGFSLSARSAGRTRWRDRRRRRRRNRNSAASGERQNYPL